MNTFLAAIYDDDRRKVQELLATDSALANKLMDNDKLYEDKIVHWLYKGDTPMHLAAAGYRVEIIEQLIDAGGNPNSAQNRRKSAPLHYSVDGYITDPAWDAKRQVKTIKCLLNAGAELIAQDNNGATALHRAVRTRCADAVQTLLEAGSDPTTWNKSGSTAFHLAVQNTGRGGTATAEAKTAQRKIIETFLSSGVRPTLLDKNGESVEDSIRSKWIRELLFDHAE